MSSVSPYLLHVNSRPTKVSDDLWSRWYMEEHLPDLVSSKTSTRATFWKELPPLLPDLPTSQRKFLALYQSDFPECLKSENYTNLRRTSELFPKEGGTKDIAENGDFDARNYELIQNHDPNGIGNNNSFSQLMTVEMFPPDPEDFDRWYREEHLDMMSHVPGFGRCLRYKIGPRTLLTKDEDPPTFLAVYEVEDVKALLGHEESIAAGTTEWSKKNISESKTFMVRGWQKVHTEG